MFQNPGAVASTLPAGMSHLSSVQTITSQSPQTSQARLSLSPQKVTINPQKVTINPQKVTISPQRMTINPQKITISPQKIGTVISGGTLGSPVGQIRLSSPQQKIGTQSIITPSGVKQVSLVGSLPRQQQKITIKSKCLNLEKYLKCAINSSLTLVFFNI